MLTERQAARLASKGVKLEVKTVRGKAASQVLREQAAAGWTAFRSYSEAGGIRDEIAAIAARYPRLTKVVTIGRTVQGKPILAVKVTKNAKKSRDGSRPSTAYVGAQHAREWITVEMTRRLMHHVLDNYGTDPTITKLLNRTELWFIPVANPDGYDYTFTAGQPAVAQEPARQQRRRADHRRRRRRPQPQLRLQVGLRQRGLLARPVQRDLPRAGTELRAGDQGAGQAVPAGRLRVLRSTTTRPPSCCSTASAGRSARPRPTTRSTRRWPATTPTPRCRATTRTSRPSSTPPTARPTPTCDGALRHARLHPRDDHL